MDDEVDPLPYIIVFFILVIISLAALTYMMDMYSKSVNCKNYPNVWCSDTWTCNNSCTGTTGSPPLNPNGLPVNECFGNINPTGLASCLFGPTSAQANLCFVPVQGSTGTACDCVSSSISNCLSGCSQTIEGISGSTKCCSVQNPINC